MMRNYKPIFFCLWLAIATLLLPCIVRGQLLKVKGEYTTTEEEETSTANSPEFQYDQDFDKLVLEDNGDIGKTTIAPTPKSRNYGSRVRGINSSPFGANSVLSSAAPGVPIPVKNRTAPIIIDSEVPPIIFSPRPTSSVISSTSTTSRGSYLKRRKNSNSTAATLITTSTTLSSILNRLGNSSLDGNRTNIFRFLNRTREDSSTPSTLSSSHRINPNNDNLTKIIIRKRPRPITLSDDNTTEAPTAIPTVQTSEDASETERIVHLGKFEIPEILPLKVRRVKPSQSAAAPKPVSLEPQPVSHYPVSSSLPSFEYNPSVSIQSGIYRYRYTEPTFSSSRVVEEDFGISHVTYNYPEEEEENVDTTTFAPAPEGPTGGPYQIKIDGSEEEFTSSLPPAYREFFGGPEDAAFGSKLPRLSKVQPVSSVVDHAVTVTVTQTILASKSFGIIPEASSKLSAGSRLEFTGTAESEDSHPHPNSIPVVRQNSTQDNPVRDLQHQQSHEDNAISPTPALPPIPIHSSTENLVEKSQESAPSSEKNKTLLLPADESLPTLPTTKHHKDETLLGKETEEEYHVNVHPAETPPTQDVSPSPGSIYPSVSSKAFTSVYFTKESNPYFTTSSYSFTSSTEYSYGHSHHSGDHPHEENDHPHEGDHPHPSHPYDQSQSSSSHSELDNTGKGQELHPSTSSYWNSLGHKSQIVNPTNSTPKATDQESGYSTAQVETERPTPGTSLTTPLPSSSTPSGPHDSGVYNDVYGNEIGDIFGEETSATPKPNNTRSNGPSYDIHPPNNDSKSTAHHNPNSDPAEPTVPVYIQVLLDMPATHFCSNLPRFKEMIVKVYGSNMNVAVSQVVIFNEQNCDKLRSKINHLQYNHTAQGNRTKARIRFATTTASVIRTVSSTARSALPAKEETNTTPLSTSTTTSTLEKPIRQRRHESQAKSEKHIQNNDRDLSGTSPSPNRSDESFPTEATTLYPVFFYLTDKNGTYDRELTEAFLDHWNTSSSALTSLPDNSMFFKKIRKINMVTPPKTEFNGNENNGIIAAITIAAIAAVGLFILGVLLLIMRHRQAQSKFAKRCTPVSLDDYSLDNISVFSSFRRKQRNRASKRSYTNAAFDDPNAPSRSLNAQGLTNILKETDKLEEEFRDLPSINPTLEDMPAGAEPKNRYANVIPMPDTRVLLTFQDDSPNSDYINANFVRGPMGTPKAYIITQGPLEETVVDFWRMIWEQQVRVIMMLTDFSEAGIGKCAEYYPRSEAVDNSQLHGDYQITLEKRDISENCITSFLVIKEMERNLRRDVVHLWYHSWPEKGVPVNARSTIDFLSRSRKYTKEPTPVVVHCSPGTGRSGTLVASDILLKEYDSHQNVNIPRTVMKIRQDRAGAVQTKDQYMHIYSVAQSYASRHSASHMDSI